MISMTLPCLFYLVLLAYLIYERILYCENIFGACLVSKFVSTGWDEYLAGTGKILMSIIRKCYILENWYDQAIWVILDYTFCTNKKSFISVDFQCLFTLFGLRSILISYLISKPNFTTLATFCWHRNQLLFQYPLRHIFWIWNFKTAIIWPVVVVLLEPGILMSLSPWLPNY